MDSFISAQIFGLLGAIAMLLSCWQKNRNKVLSFLIIDGICYFIQYLLLGAFSGALTNLFGLIRVVIFQHKEKNKYLQSNLILYIMIVVYLLIGILTYDGLISILPVLSAIIYTSTLWQDDVKNIRIGTTIMVSACFIYNIMVDAYIGALLEGTLFISSVIAIIKIDILKDKRSKQIDKILKQ